MRRKIRIRATGKRKIKKFVFNFGNLKFIFGKENGIDGLWEGIWVSKTGVSGVMGISKNSSFGCSLVKPKFSKGTSSSVLSLIISSGIFGLFYRFFFVSGSSSKGIGGIG